MARLEPLAPDATPELEHDFQRFTKLLGYVPNNVLIMARKPNLVKGVAQLASAIWDPASEVNAGLKRLVAYMASKTHGSRYSMAHAADAAHRAGTSDARIEAIDHYRTSPLFSEAERAALDFAVAAASQPSAVTDDLFERVRRHWTETQIVEIVVVIAMNGFLNRWNDAFAPSLEEEPAVFVKKHIARYF